uniref:Cation-chloride cotransporter 1 n=1 Tax=Tanacetum cinerariifolium TaxID=118510 RepID=A0A6L2MLS1_TANCI|nr:cation-chloride cotransporter 1 [Tanacetum cinerariifolium]
MICISLVLDDPSVGNMDAEASDPNAFKQFTLDLGTIVCALNIWAKEDSDAGEIADVRKFLYDLRVQAKVVVISMKTRNHKGHDGGVRDQTQEGSVEAFSSVNEQQDFRSGSWMPIRAASEPYALIESSSIGYHMLHRMSPSGSKNEMSKEHVSSKQGEADGKTNGNQEESMSGIGNKSNISFVNVTGSKISELDKKLVTILTEVDSSGNEVVIFDDVLIVEGCKRLELTLYGYFVGNRIIVNELRYNLRRMWNIYGFRIALMLTMVF